MVEDILFSIVIPTYNRGHLIDETIKSVLKQTYQNYEIIIVDDGSTDNTQQLINTFSDKRIKYYKKNNEERSIARNFGLNKAKGNYVYLLDSDDIIYSHHLKTAFEFINKSNKVDAFFFTL
jgi:glycosyltransferase involved in cell wall biosynthesis